MNADKRISQLRALGLWPASLVQDARIGLRVLRKSPGFTFVAILTLALGIGASTAIFTLLNAILYRELPAPHAEQLVQLRTRFHTGIPAPLALPMFQELQKGQKVFSGMFSWSGGGPANVQVDGKLSRNNVLYVSGDFYSQLGVRPLLGRLIEPADANPDAPISRVAVISYAFWKSRFAGSPAIVGKQLLLENHPFTIVGVTDKTFVGLYVGTPQDITVPITASGLVNNLPFQLTSAHYLWLNAIGRLRSGVSIAQARGQLSGIWPAILSDVVPSDEKGERREQYLSMSLIVTSAARGPDWEQREQYWRPLYYLTGMVALILLAVCVNLASPMLARGAGRIRETSVRLALGATRRRIAAQMLTEGLLLSSAGAILGLLFGFWGARWMYALLTRFTVAPVDLDLRPDFHILAFVAALAALTAILFGLMPAFHAAAVDPGALLREDSRLFVSRSSRIGQALIVAQISLSLMLVLACTLFTRSFWNLRSAAPGYDRASVLNLWLLNRPGVAKNLDVNAYDRELTRRLDALPGVVASGLAEFTPGAAATGGLDNVAPVGTLSSKGPICNISAVAPGFFNSIGMTLLAGRDFAWTDDTRHPRVAVVSSSLAERLFPRGNAIGSLVNVGTFPAGQDVEIVGIVNDARLYDPRDARPLNIFLDSLQASPAPEAMMLFVRAAKIRSRWPPPHARPSTLSDTSLSPGASRWKKSRRKA